jgi:hypothetical protein
MSTFEIAMAIVMFVGLVGVLVPVFPGLILVAGAGIFWAMQRGSMAAWAVVVVMAMIGAAGIVVSTVLPARRATASGAPTWIVVAGGMGVVIGFFAVPVVGALIGFPAGVLIAELTRHRQLGPAWRATLEALKGVALGIVIQLAAGVAMIGLWLAGVFAT